MLFAKIYILFITSNNLKYILLIAFVTLLITLRIHNTQVNENAQSRSPEHNNADVDNSVERVPEDLAGRVCYELEPLVLS